MRTDDNGQEVGMLLTFIGALDGRTAVDAATKYAWGRALASVPDQQAEDAALAFFTEPVKPGTRREWITPAVILERAALANRETTAQVEADVRAARARGIVPRDWPDRMALPAPERHRLQQAREADRQEATRLQELDEATTGLPVDTSVVLRGAPAAAR